MASPRAETVAIVGANLAGGRAAEHLARNGYNGRIILIGAEKHAPYERPELSKGILSGTTTAQSLFLKPEGEWLASGVELVLGTPVARLLLSEQAVELAGGRRIPAGKILLATGARVRKLDIPGAALPGVCYLRTIDDALRLRSYLVPDARVVVVGAGLIGAEVAASASGAGCRVTLVEADPVPMARTLGAEIGAIYADYHRSHGVTIRTGTIVHSIGGDDHVRFVVAADGSRIEADCVVIGVGVQPRAELAVAAGIRVDNGIVVDEYCRTSIDNVYAAGDVANSPSSIPGQRIRLEHWQNAQAQAVAAADSMMGNPRPFRRVPWFWSDQYGINLQVAGHPSGQDQVVIRGRPSDADFSAFYLQDKRLTAALAVNRPRELRAVNALIRSASMVDPAELADESIDLRRLGGA